MERLRHTRPFVAALALVIAAPSADAAAVKSVEFIGMAAPKTITQMTSAYSNAKVRVTYADGASEVRPLTYTALFRNTERVGGNPHEAGRLYDATGAALKDPNGDPVIAETPDGNSLLRLPGGEIYLLTHWEYDWLLKNGDAAYRVEGWHPRMPMTMSLTGIGQRAADGRLTAISQRNVDFSAVGGLWIPCAASQTPWNTHLGGEEDYDLFDRKKVDNRIAGLDAVYFGKPGTANPYRYGYNVEVMVKPGGGTKVVKHYAMGRAAWEKAQVLADERTAYMGDDGRYVGLFMFVADRAGELSSGTLYAGKWRQISGDNGGKARLSWIRLGHGGQAEIEAMVEAEKFSSKESTIFEFSNAPETGYTTIRAGLKKTNEHVKLKPGKARAAAFLETRRYAALRGASIEFNKMEGVAFNAADRKVYIAISDISGAMTEADGGPTDDVRVNKIGAGGVYELSLAGGVRDTDGALIASDYVAIEMAGMPALMAEDLDFIDAFGNTADPDKIAGPDNLFFSEKMRTLFIGEDSGKHANNFVWAYNVDTGKLARILSVPAGAEATGLQVVENLGGHAYIMSNYQHAGEHIRIRDMAFDAEVKAATDKQTAVVGYIGGLPGL